MNKILKFPWETRHKMFFSSDWHVFHNPSWDVPIWKMRGYENAQDAAIKIQEKINERVPEDGIIIYVGDMFLNASDEQCLAWLKGINCKNIKKVFGNHTSNMFRLYKQEVKKQYNLDDVEVYPLKMGNVEFLGNEASIQVGKQLIVVNHFPYHSWNRMGHGSIMASGHSHSSDPTRNPNCPINRCIDLSWDWKKDLWSFEEMMEIMSTKTFVAVDHHNKNTN